MTLEKILKELKRIERGGIIPKKRIYVFINYDYRVFRNHKAVEERSIRRDVEIDELLKIDFLNIKQEAYEEHNHSNSNTFKFCYYEMIGQEEEGNGTSENLEIVIY